MKKYKWLMKKDLYEEHLKTFNCFLENKLIHTHNSYEYIVEYNKYLEDELERLNNIINKLEIDIEIGVGKYEYDTDYNRGLSDAFIYMNDRLKELKGVDSDE